MSNRPLKIFCNQNHNFGSARFEIAHPLTYLEGMKMRNFLKGLKNLLIGGVMFASSLFAGAPAAVAETGECPRDTLPTTMWVLWLAAIGAGVGMYIAYDRKREEVADAENLLELGREEKIELMRQIGRLRRENKMLQAANIGQEELQEYERLLAATRAESEERGGHNEFLRETLAATQEELEKTKELSEARFQQAEMALDNFSKVEENYEKLYAGYQKLATENRNVTQQLRATLTNSVVKIADKNEAAAEFEEKISELEETVLFLEEQIDKLVGKNSKLFGEKQELEGKIVFFSSEITRLSQSNGQPDKNQQQLQIIDLRDDLHDRQKAVVNR
ncbi:MAG: hypothetical protein A3F54_00280 [Candidatus Kerfeldbacteria bacterium RIFCSPHIGHO2_12_FULL_48_17]|uniref:Uncharacterized protein n=1 Tax=Candidatus Kerfeldbacteria bacterium RIFCSPHIGHO2_12_FULL_48_17 TaxID=1798542 RepID=A0A1G2B0D9_9BACT|nr:MAG: hypothetical protein A3F54_00280 [Candidatus Kerfeldbacteria bacterium RIFCSPHIGHO2_12_FULL_48_17]